MKHLLLGLLLLGSASAAQLRLYPSFAEVREPVEVRNGLVTLSFGQEAAGSLVPGSLSVEGVDLVSGLSKVAPSWLATQEGQGVWLDREGKTERVTLVRAEDLLVRDAQGRYRTVTFDQLSFDTLPPPNPAAARVQYTYRVKGTGAILSYLTRAVSWSPSYTLRAQDSSAELTGLAELRNASDAGYAVNAGAELFAGEVNLTGPQPFARDFAVPAAAPPAPKISGGGELRGLRQYTLSSAFTLPGQATLELPFLTPQLSTFQRYGALSRRFDPQPAEGKLDRAYRLRADTFLPAGPLTVRDEGRIVGQTDLGDTPRGEVVDFTLGADADLSYARAVQVKRQDKTGAVYQVTYTFENAKDRPLRAEVSETYSGDTALSGQAERTPQGLSLKVDLPAKGKVTRTYTLSFKYGG